jgi:hypothetical protein
MFCCVHYTLISPASSHTYITMSECQTVTLSRDVTSPRHTMSVLSHIYNVCHTCISVGVTPDGTHTPRSMPRHYMHHVILCTLCQCHTFCHYTKLSRFVTFPRGVTPLSCHVISHLSQIYHEYHVLSRLYNTYILHRSVTPDATAYAKSR